MKTSAETIGILGFGRIGERLARSLMARSDGPRLVAILVRPSTVARVEAAGIGHLAATTFEAFVDRRPALVVECGSPDLLAEFAPRLLASGIDTIPLSLTAFVDPGTEKRLLLAAATGPGHLEIPPGALGTLDLLAAAREAGLSRVVYRQCKSPEMWKRTPAVGLADLSAIHIRTVFASGTVREIAARFPDNLNVSVGVALAGLGLDRTEIELVADPDARETSHELDADAPPGNIRLRVGGRTVAPDGDPVDYSTFSLLRLVNRRQARVRI